MVWRTRCNWTHPRMLLANRFFLNSKIFWSCNCRKSNYRAFRAAISPRRIEFVKNNLSQKRSLLSISLQKCTNKVKLFHFFSSWRFSRLIVGCVIYKICYIRTISNRGKYCGALQKLHLYTSEEKPLSVIVTSDFDAWANKFVIRNAWERNQQLKTESCCARSNGDRL